MPASALASLGACMLRTMLGRTPLRCRQYVTAGLCVGGRCGAGGAETMVMRRMCPTHFAGVDLSKSTASCKCKYVHAAVVSEGRVRGCDRAVEEAGGRQAGLCSPEAWPAPDDA